MVFSIMYLSFFPEVIFVALSFQVRESCREQGFSEIYSTAIKQSLLPSVYTHKCLEKHLL